MNIKVLKFSFSILHEILHGIIGEDAVTENDCMDLYFALCEQEIFPNFDQPMFRLFIQFSQKGCISQPGQEE